MVYLQVQLIKEKLYIKRDTKKHKELLPLELSFQQIAGIELQKRIWPNTAMLHKDSEKQEGCL